MESIGKMIDHEASEGRQTELEAIMHNHASILMKEIAYQPKDEVEAFVPTTAQDIFGEMDKDGDGEASKEEFAAAMRLQQKDISDEEIDRIFRQLDTDGGGTLTVDDGDIQAGGETTHSGTWQRATVVGVGHTHITVQIHPDENAVAAAQPSLSDLGSPSGMRTEPPAPNRLRRLQIPWVQLNEIDAGEDPGGLMLTRIRPVSEETLADEKQEENRKAATLRAKREKEAKEAAARGESLTRTAKAMWAQKGKGERKGSKGVQGDQWDQGTNIDAFIKKHDIRILGSQVAEPTAETKETVKQAAKLLSAAAFKGR